ncbi:MAG: hypothetical protein PUE61_11760 [Clostridiales bacterium]|nr:hypothetical protein [Clostridiales bacterium]
MRKMLALLLALLMIVSCIPALAEDAAVKTGLSFVTSVSSSKDGQAQANIAITAVTVDDNGVITACAIDYIQAKIAFDENGKLTTDKATEFLSKNELGDGYGMRKASSIAKEWNEQAAAFAAYCVGKTLEEVKNMPVNDKNKPADVDLAASCTLAVSEFLPGVEDAVNNAAHMGAKKGDVLKLTQVTTMSKSKDATETADGQAQAYTHVAAITLNGNTITSCYIDAVQATVKFNAQGKITSDIAAEVQSKNTIKEGYGMKAISSIGKEWYEQAAGFCAYVTGKTIEEVAGIAIVDGKIADADLAATTTIGIADFQALIEKAGK